MELKNGQATLVFTTEESSARKKTFRMGSQPFDGTQTDTTNCRREQIDLKPGFSKR